MYDLDDVHDKLTDIERAVRNNKPEASTSPWVWYLVGAIGWIFVSSICSDVFYSKFSYAMQYSVSVDQVHIADKPHDCAFIAAPIGNKYCHYERTILRSDDVRAGVTTHDDVYVEYTRVEDDE
jgi:hypothetical protein